jgi:hypothetical protein
VGCNHGIQPRTGGFADYDGAEANEQRQHFKAMLAEICSKNRIQIVLEEDGTLEETAAEQLAISRGVPWENINTTNEDKDRMGIPRNYLTGPFTQQEKTEWNRQRDIFMAEKVVSHRADAENAVIICGFDHLEPLAALLEGKGIPVRVWDYRSFNWYRQGIFPDNP